MKMNSSTFLYSATFGYTTETWTVWESTSKAQRTTSIKWKSSDLGTIRSAVINILFLGVLTSQH